MKLIFINILLIFISVQANLSVIPLPRKIINAHETCGKNEIFMECGKNCQTECPTLGQPCLTRQFKCSSGCYCIEGYARQTKHGRCIPISNCPNNFSSLFSGGYNRDPYSQQYRNPQKQLPPYNNNRKKNSWPYQQISLGEHSQDSQER